MKKFFIFMLFALNMVYFQQALASLSAIDQTMIFYADEDKPDDSSDEDGDAKEEDCE